MKRVAEKDSIKRKEIFEWTKGQPDGDYLVEVKRYWLKTDAQQGYYWGVVLETLAKETWYCWVQLLQWIERNICMEWLKGCCISKHQETWQNLNIPNW